MIYFRQYLILEFNFYNKNLSLKQIIYVTFMDLYKTVLFFLHAIMIYQLNY